MAPDAANGLTWYLLLHTSRGSDLGAIRHWSNLKIGYEENQIWVKGFTLEQVEAVEVKSLPYKTIFYEHQNKIYRQNSLLPDQPIPNVLWTPISRGLPVTLPGFNHHYFGISEKIEVRIIPAKEEHAAVALITTLEKLQAYLVTAPVIRLKNTNWAILDGAKVLLIGTPLLPVPGEAFWKRKDFLLPAGFDFDLFILAEALNNIINPNGQNWIIWNPGSSYFTVPKNALKPLSLSSFRLSLPEYSLRPNLA